MNTSTKTKKIVLTALFIALSFVGANIKVAGSIAFDSMPGFLGALLVGPGYGAIIGALGHFLTAATSGFYLTLPVHLIIMVDMALTMYVFGLSYKLLREKNHVLAILVSVLLGVIINGPLSTFMVMPLTGKGIIIMLPILSLIALINIVLAHGLYILLPKSIKQWK